MKSNNDDMYFIMNILAMIAVVVVAWPVIIIAVVMALLVGMNPLTWMGAFLIWFNKRID